MKFPPHTFDPGPPTRWTFRDGGSVSHVVGSRSIACERCHVTSRAVIHGAIDYATLATFLNDHAGETCSSAGERARRKR